jgi:hypothetical protein
MRFNLLVIFLFFFTLSSKGSISKDSVAIDQDSISHWTKKNNTRLIFTQNSFVNWSAGGNNSISGILKINIQRNFKTSHIVWVNQLKSSYGLNKEEKRELRKTEDLFEINSTFGYKKNILSNWYNSAKFNFRTQLSNGYKYPNTDKPISKFFAPAYLFLGIGSEYASKETQLKIYLSPVTNKTTFVFNQTLADEGAFGVDPAVYDELENIISKGKNSKVEFGTLITAEWEAEVMKNIKMANKIILYSDYMHNYGDVDVNWEINFDLTINKYVTANIGSQLIYDDDDHHKEDINNDGVLDILGPRVQLKQLLGVGFSYDF